MRQERRKDPPLEALRDLVMRIRDELLSAEDTVCLERAYLVTEAWARYEREPPPLRRAKAFAHVLSNMTLDLRSNPFFAGNTSSKPRAWMLIPEHGIGVCPQIAIENESLRGFLKGKVPGEILDFWRGRSFGGICGIGHLAVDMGLVVGEGLEALIEEAERRNRRDPDRSRCAYREAMIIALQAVIDWAGRYAAEAERLARTERNPLVRSLLLKVARSCRRVPGKPARDLHEALQAMALAHLAVAVEGHGMSISIGLPDRVLKPFVKGADDWLGTCLVAAFVLKVAANSFQGRGSKTQAITVGGADYKGEDQANPATFWFLDAAQMLRVGDPHLFLRWHKGLDPAVRRRAAEMICSGTSMPLLINDHQTAEGLVRLGVAPEDAWEYCVIGCNELGIPGRLMSVATSAIGGDLVHIELLNEALLSHPHPDGIGGVEEVVHLYEEALRRRAFEMRRRGWEGWRRMAEEVPTPFTSALMRGCIERGEDLLLGAKYLVPGYYERGLTNAVNALAAIDRLVFKKRALRLGQIVEATRRDFEGEEGRKVRELLRAAPKWGEDDDEVDRWAMALLEARERVLSEVDREFGDRAHAVCHVVRSLNYVDGRRLPATVDGRRARAPIADSIGAEGGTSREGPTALLNSVLKIDYLRHYRGGYNLNLTLPKGEVSPDIVLALVEGFFSQGGQELQINCLDAGMLREAQRDPERYRDLVVRVAGFCARFVDLSREQQEEIIARAEAFSKR